MLNNTLIVITSDHGELLGEHGFYFYHGTGELFEQEIKVGCIFYHKGRLREKTISRQVESIDIVPTILEYLGIPKDKRM